MKSNSLQWKKTALLAFLICSQAILSGLEVKGQLISNHDPLFMPWRPKPGVNIPFTDPVFNTAVNRLTNAVLSGNQGIVPHYSKRQAWNANDSLMILMNGDDGYFGLYDGQTCQFIRPLEDPSIGGDDVFWHPLQNNIIIYPADSILYSYDVETNERTLLHVFSDYSWINSRGEGNLTMNGQYYAFIGQNYNYSTGEVTFSDAVVYDIPNDSIVGLLELPPAGSMGDLDWISISPLGNYVVFEFGDDEPERYHGVEVYDRNFNFLRRLGSGSGHSDLGLDENGDEIYVKIVYDPEDNVERVFKYRLSDGQTTVLLDFSAYFCPHVSLRSTDLSGWCFMSTFDYVERLTDDSLTWLPFEDEIFALKLNGSGDVRRIAHHHSRRFSPITPDPDNSVYWSEPHATVNKAGNRIIWGSNWRENMQFTWGVDTYLCDFQIPGTVPLNRTVQNITVAAGQEQCYSAVQTVTLAGNGSTFIVQNGANVTVIAGQKILFLPGTKIQHGSSFHGYITETNQYCSNQAKDFDPANSREVSHSRLDAMPGIKVYPNPTQGSFRLEFKGDYTKTKTRMKICDILGVTVFEQDIDPAGIHEFSLTRLTPGAYFIRLIRNDGAVTIKLMKN